MNGNGNNKSGIKTNVDDFNIKVKKDHVTVTYFAGEKQVAQVNFLKQPFGVRYLQALQTGIWGGSGTPEMPDGDGGYHADQPDYVPPPELRFSREEMSEDPEDQ